MNHRNIIRVPYTTLPNFERYDGPLLRSPPSRAHLAEKHEMFADDARLGASWFETETARAFNLAAKAAARLGLDECASLKDIAHRIEEDIAIIHHGRMEACCFMFPSGWAPEEKAGMDFAALHAPVADGERLRAAGPRIAALMCGDYPYHRYVWGLSSSPKFSAHPRYRDKTPPPRTLDDVFFRYEHQITVPLEKDVNSLFLVAVDVLPFRELSNEARTRIRQSIATMTPNVVAYKGIAPFADILGQE